MRTHRATQDEARIVGKKSQVTLSGRESETLGF